ncbi:MAG: hypothetical protein WAN76_01660 [Candidatus Sulfotelmatobacter sp.]
MFIVARGNGPHIATRISMNWARVLAFDLLSPVLMIRHPDVVAWFGHGCRLECTNRQPYAQRRQLAVTKVTVGCMSSPPEIEQKTIAAFREEFEKLNRGD